MKNLKDWLALYLVPELGPVSCKQLVNYFGEPRLVFAAKPSDISKVAGIRKAALAGINKDPAYEKAENEIAQAQAKNITIISWDDPRYPPLLRNIHNPPVLLYIKGSLPPANQPAIAIVGARAATVYGQRIAKNMAAKLSGRGITVVSGLALGIDTAAHQGVINSNGQTVAVLGCGVDVIYPRQNNQLYQNIQRQGALISEYPLGTRPESFRFPARNRIISGLSLGVLVVEAARRSGSLITAQLALEQGREVFAVPGMADSAKSEGTHRLVQDGAKLTYTVDDIIEELTPYCSAITQKGDITAPPTTVICPKTSDEEKNLLSFLDVYPKTIDEITTQANLTTAKVNELLLMLELKNLVKSLHGKQYQKK